MNPYGALYLPWYTLAALLLLVHLWYDFHVQGNYISVGKKTSNFLLTIHAMTWALVISVPLYVCGILTVEQFAFLLSTHWVMDWMKCHRLPNRQWSLVVDQLVHFVTLGVCLWQW